MAKKRKKNLCPLLPCHKEIVQQVRDANDHSINHSIPPSSQASFPLLLSPFAKAPKKFIKIGRKKKFKKISKGSKQKRKARLPQRKQAPAQEGKPRRAMVVC